MNEREKKREREKKAWAIQVKCESSLRRQREMNKMRQEFMKIKMWHYQIKYFYVQKESDMQHFQQGK